MISRKSNFSKLTLVLCSFVVFISLSRLLGYLLDLQALASGKPPANIETGYDLQSYTINGNAKNDTFIYSKDEVFHTVLGIRRKNCLLANKGESSICQELEQCNNQSTLIPDTSPSCDQRLPRSLVIGVAKSGTLEIMDFLYMNHMVAIKREPYLGSYFSGPSYNRGISWYKGKMPYTMPTQITIEKGNYFHDPLIPGRIQEMDPDIKMLLMLRDPVDRTLSQLTFRLSVEPSLEILNENMNNLTRITSVRWSMYDEAFERFLQHFKRSQIHIVDFERFKHDPFGVLRDIETFLGLPHAIQKEDFVFNDEKGFYCLRAVGQRHSVCFGEDRGRKKTGDPFVEYKPMLRRLFKPHNERFAELVGQKISWL